MGTRYILEEENRTWNDVSWIITFLKGAAYCILGHDELPDAKGLTVTTEQPIKEEHRRRLGLRPINTP